MYRRLAPSYLNKPFKPPVLQSKNPSVTHQLGLGSGFAPARVSQASTKRSISNTNSQEIANKRPKAADDCNEKLYMVLFRKRTTKKHKTWDGEGILIVHANGTATFRCDTLGGDNYREEGRRLTKFSLEGVIPIGSFEVEVDHEVLDPAELAQFTKYFTPSSASASSPQPKAVPLVPGTPSPPLTPKQTVTKSVPLPTMQFKPLVARSTTKKKRSPMFDPKLDNAFVMPRPPGEDSNGIVDVVVDPALARHLRAHQKEGVMFLYECVMGFRDFGGNGALLADEMGLGKTLTTITLIWTLLRQNYSLEKTHAIQKVLIVCPVTLIGNWKREFKKWLGTQHISVLTINGSNNLKADKLSVVNFGKTRVYQVLIMGYEKVSSVTEELESVDIDLLICDEGHRLKSGQGKTLKVLNGLDIDKRVLLTGTPIQNDLNEFYNIINFINPGVLGPLSKFQRDFMKPILRAREINCTNKQVIEMGDEKSNELIEITKSFTLRRTNAILTDFLPPKTDVILFARPTKLQLSLFDFLMDTKYFNKALSKNNQNESLSLIMLFRKICNSPSLVIGDEVFQDLNFKGGKPLDLSKKVVSGKIKVLIQLLGQIRRTGEKVVLISNFTQTLDILEKVVKQIGYSFLRLDGSTVNKTRDKIVADFNNTSLDGAFIFLLSAKSGGVGLNLIGASRLILFDNDWNPATDLQAMARVHRDGQRKPVFIYRLITTGSIDEKIFQRQLMKSNLSDKFLDGKSDSKDDLFDYNDLRDLFTLDRDHNSNTHEMLECDCSGMGEELAQVDFEEESDEKDEGKSDSDQDSEPKDSWMSALDYKQLSQDPTKKKNAIKNCLQGYRHLDPQKCTDFEDEVLARMSLNADLQKNVSYMFIKVNKKLIQ